MESKDILAAVGITALVAAGAAVVGNAAFNKIGIEFVGADFNFNQLTLGRVGVDIQIRVTNGNSIGGTLNRVRGSISYGNVILANVDTPAAIAIPPNGIGTGIINVSVEAAVLVADIIAAFANNSAYSVLVNNLVFDGTFYTNIVNVPARFNIPIVVQGL